MEDGKEKEKKEQVVGTKPGTAKARKLSSPNHLASFLAVPDESF